MAKLQEIKHIIANLSTNVQTTSAPLKTEATTQTSSAPLKTEATTQATSATLKTDTITYPVKPEPEKKPEVHDVAPVKAPTYSAAPTSSEATNGKEEKVPAAATVVSIATAPTGMLPNKAAVDAFVRRLTPGIDLMSIPGIPKPILTKTGAIKIIKFFGVQTNITLLDKTVDPAQEFISYSFKVSAIFNGECVYEAIGCANSHEPKFKGKGMGSDPTVSQVSIKRAIVALAMYLLVR